MDTKVIPLYRPSKFCVLALGMFEDNPLFAEVAVSPPMSASDASGTASFVAANLGHIYKFAA